jgi:hypothetical protein
VTLTRTLDAIVAEMKRCTPSSGYNLVGIDLYEPPGDCAYVVGHFATREAAEAALRSRTAADPDERLHVYGPAAGPGASSAGPRQNRPRRGDHFRPRSRVPLGHQ